MITSYPIEIIINNPIDLGAWAGIVGAFTGILALIISFFSYRLNIPHIVVEKVYLEVISKSFRDQLEEREDKSSTVLTFSLDIIIRNKSGGAGSIDKPVLEMSADKYKIQIYPNTSHDVYSEKMPFIATHTIRDGYALNISAGQTVDEKITYNLRGAEDIERYIKNFEKMNYKLIYKDNTGRTRSVVPEVIIPER